MLFFLLKPVFGTALLRLHRFQAFCRRFLVRRKVEIESNVELIPTINIYPADKLMPLQPLIL